MLSTELKQLAQPILDDIVNHPFVVGLQKGELPKEAISIYVEQDTRFLENFSKVYAAAFIHASTRKDLTFLARQVAFSLADEAQAHQVLLDYAGEKLADHQNAPMRPETYAYNEHLFNAVRNGDFVDIMAALIPCPWTYHQLCQVLLRTVKAGNPFLPWLQFYYPANDDHIAVEIESSIQTMFSMLDDREDTLTAAHKTQVKRYFLLSCEYEWRFWEQAYRGIDWRYQALVTR